MDKELGTYVAERRRSLNLRQSDLADKLGYSTQAISKFEGLESQISLSVVPDLCNLFGESIDDFFLRTSEPVRPLNTNKPIDQKLLSSNLAVFRGNQGLTLVQESQAIGIAKNTLISYEKGTSLPTLDAMDRFFIYAKLTPSSFLYEKLPSTTSLRPARSKKPLIVIFSSIAALAMVGGLAYWVVSSFKGYGSKESAAETSAPASEPTGSTSKDGGSSGSSSSSSSSSASSSSSSSSSSASSVASSNNPNTPPFSYAEILDETGVGTNAIALKGNKFYYHVHTSDDAYFYAHPNTFNTYVELSVSDTNSYVFVADERYPNDPLRGALMIPAGATALNFTLSGYMSYANHEADALHYTNLYGVIY